MLVSRSHIGLFDDERDISLCDAVAELIFDCIIEHMGKVDEKTLGRITDGV